MRGFWPTETLFCCSYCLLVDWMPDVCKKEGRNEIIWLFFRDISSTKHNIHKCFLTDLMAALLCRHVGASWSSKSEPGARQQQTHSDRRSVVQNKKNTKLL